MPLITRQEKGSKLTIQEMDGNLNYLRGLSVPSAAELDFIILDWWKNDNDSLNQSGNGLYYVSDEMSVIKQYENKNDSLDRQIAGVGTNPFVPISQTTIFVHPTTFERYLFNGTTMEVYDDVDGVVPKWLEWRGFLNQPFNVAEINVRLLNQDAKDFFYGVSVYITNDEYHSTVIDLGKRIDLNLLDIDKAILNEAPGLLFAVPYIDYPIAGKTSIMIDAYNGGIQNSSFNIKQRLRGAPPKLLSAETNTAGDKIILTFDKEINKYDASNGQNLFYTSFNNGEDVFFENLEIEGNIITFNANSILHEEVVNISTGLGVLESLDLGLLQPFENIPVTNNVPAPPQLIDVYTNTVGDRVTLVFDKDIENTSPMTTSVFNVWDSENTPTSYSEFSVFEKTITIDTTNIKLSGLIPPSIVEYYSFGANEVKAVDGSLLQDFYELPILNIV